MKRTLIALGALAMVASANAQSLYNNATGNGHTLTLEGLFTDTHGNGIDRASALQTALGNNVFGFGAQTLGPNMMSDDFVVPAGQNWTITALTFFMYQTGATAATINALSWRIDDVDLAAALANPTTAPAPLMSGGVLLADVPTVTMTDLYRVLDTDLTGTLRRIQKVVVNTTGDLTAPLPPGQYWITWSAGGTLASGPWQPPLTKKGATNDLPADAKQFIGSTVTWNNPLLDNGVSAAPQDLPFWIDGTPGGPEVVVPSSFATVLGRLDAGNVGSLAADDDDYLRHCKFIVPNALVAPVRVRVNGTTTKSSTTGIAAACKGRMASGGSFSLGVEQRNFVSAVNQDLATGAVGTSEVTVTSNTTGNHSDMIGGGGALQAEYLVRQTGPSVVSLWCFNADQFTWTVN